MILQKLPPFTNVIADGVAMLRMPRYAMTLTRLVLRLGGTAFTKAMIADIKIKLGVRTVYNISGPLLDAINKYKGIQDDDSYLTIDFTERDAPTIQGKEIGGYDLSQIRDEVTFEVTIAGATAPTLEAIAFMTPPQGNALIQKILYFPTSSAVAGKFPIQFNPMGALIKRVHFFYSGDDWDVGVDGNVSSLEVKKNGLVIWDMSCRDARFVQSEYQKFPQPKHYVYDPIVDNNANGMLVTADAKSLEFNTTLAAPDSIRVYVELLDAPYNA